MATKKTTSTAVTKWDEELARRAKVATKMEQNTGTGGQYFSIAGGILSFNDQPMPDNQMAVVVVDAVLENAYYDQPYDPKGDAVPPSCYALARDEADLAPHERVVKAKTAEHDVCKGCPQNEYGTARVGRGKACKNTRRLALLPAGRFLKDGTFEPIEDPDHYAGAPLGILRIPVTSIVPYANWVRQVEQVMHRPPLGVFCKVACIKDPERQVALTFETLAKVPDELLGALFQRADNDTEGLLMQPYPEPEDKPARGKAAPAKRARGKAAPAKRARKY